MNTRIGNDERILDCGYQPYRDLFFASGEILDHLQKMSFRCFPGMTRQKLPRDHVTQ